MISHCAQCQHRGNERETLKQNYSTTLILHYKHGMYHEIFRDIKVMLMLTYHIMRAVNVYSTRIVCIIDHEFWTPPIDHILSVLIQSTRVKHS